MWGKRRTRKSLQQQEALRVGPGHKARDDICCCYPVRWTPAFAGVTPVFMAARWGLPLQGLIEIRDDVVGVLDADGEADNIGAGACELLLFFRQLTMCRR